MQHFYHSILAGGLLGLAAALWLPPGRLAQVAALLDGVEARAQSADGYRYPTSRAPAGPPEEGGAALASDTGFDAYRPTDENVPLEASINQFESAQIVARVGGEVILAGELLPYVNELLAANADRIPPDQMERARIIATQQALTILVQTKLLVADARRSIPKENLPKVQEQLDASFEKQEVKRLMEALGAATRDELEARLAERGSSLEQERLAFSERELAKHWRSEQIDRDEDIPREEIVAYYREHLADYEVEPKARWEQLTIRVDCFSSRREARAEIARLGNLVLLDGAPFAEVAKAHSHGTTAHKGGAWGWTAPGSLVSEALEGAVFSLPVNRLSTIIEDGDAFHIIRVVERQDGGRRPFSEVQVEIRKLLQTERAQAQLQEYLARVTKEIRVWTIYDPPESPEQLTGRPDDPPR